MHNVQVSPSDEKTFAVGIVTILVVNNTAEFLGTFSLDSFVVYLHGVQYVPQSMSYTLDNKFHAVTAKPVLTNNPNALPTEPKITCVGSSCVSNVKNSNNDSDDDIGIGLIIIIIILGLGLIGGVVYVIYRCKTSQKQPLTSTSLYTNYENPLKEFSNPGFMSGSPFAMPPGSPSGSPQRLSAEQPTPQPQEIKGELEFGFGAIPSEDCDGFGFSAN